MLRPWTTRLAQWRLAGALLTIALAGASSGCGDARAQAPAAAATPTPPPPSASAPAIALPPALSSALTRSDASFHLGPGMLQRPIGEMADRVELSLDPARGYALSLSRAAACQISADDAEVRFHTDAQGHTQVEAVTLNGRPAVLRTSAGKALLIGSQITLRLDAHGLNSVELPGDGGAMLAVPSAWFGPPS